MAIDEKSILERLAWLTGGKCTLLHKIALVFKVLNALAILSSTADEAKSYGLVDHVGIDAYERYVSLVTKL